MDLMRNDYTPLIRVRLVALDTLFVMKTHKIIDEMDKLWNVYQQSDPVKQAELFDTFIQKITRTSIEW